VQAHRFHFRIIRLLYPRFRMADTKKFRLVIIVVTITSIRSYIVYIRHHTARHPAYARTILISTLKNFPILGHVSIQFHHHDFIKVTSNYYFEALQKTTRVSAKWICLATSTIPLQDMRDMSWFEFLRRDDISIAATIYYNLEDERHAYRPLSPASNLML
jgi:hypothetical protein